MGLKVDSSKVRAELLKRAAEFPAVAGAALYAEANIEMTEMKHRTPVWNPARPVPKGHAPGSLRASGRVHEPEYRWSEGGKKRVSVKLSFGNQVVNYALWVHEDPDAFHATGEWRYMAGVLAESAPYMPQRLAKRLGGLTGPSGLTMTVRVEA